MSDILHGFFSARVARKTDPESESESESEGGFRMESESENEFPRPWVA